MEEEEDDEDGDGADGQVDVEAPPPRDLVGEYAADQGAKDVSETIGDSQHAGQEWPLLGGR